MPLSQEYKSEFEEDGSYFLNRIETTIEYEESLTKEIISNYDAEKHYLKLAVEENRVPQKKDHYFFREAYNRLINQKESPNQL